MWYKKNHKKQETIYRLIWLTMIPVVGFILLGIIDYFAKPSHGELEEYFNVMNSKEIENMGYLRPINVEDEVNKIAMEEALSINEFKTRRKMVMDTLQEENILGYLEVLKKALSNEDTETVHYATAVIINLQNKINQLAIEKEEAYLRNSYSKKVISEWEECLERIIFSGVYDEYYLYKYIRKYKALSEQVLMKEEVEERYYLNRLRLDFKYKDLTHAGEMCEIYKARYPRSEDMVICYMKYYVMSQDKNRLRIFLEELKDLPVTLTQKSLQYIRFFQV